MVAVVLVFHQRAHLGTGGRIKILILKDRIDQGVGLGLGEAQHVFKLWVQSQKGGHIKARGHVVHGYGQHPGNKDIGNGASLTTLFEGFEKGFEKAVVRSQLSVELILVGCDQLIGEIVVFVNNNVERRQVIFFDITEQSAQTVGYWLVGVDFRHVQEKRVFIAHILQEIIAMDLEAAFNDLNIFAGFYNGKVQRKDKTAVLSAGRVLSDPSMTEKFAEAVCHIEIVIIAEDGAEQRLAEASRSEEDRVVHHLQLGEPMGFIDKIAVFLHQLGIVGNAVKDAFFHGLDCGSLHEHGQQIQQPNQKSKQGTEQVDVLKLFLHNREKEPLKAHKVKGVYFFRDHVSDVQSAY